MCKKLSKVSGHLLKSFQSAARKQEEESCPKCCASVVCDLKTREKNQQKCGQLFVCMCLAPLKRNEEKETLYVTTTTFSNLEGKKGKRKKENQCVCYVPSPANTDNLVVGWSWRYVLTIVAVGFFLSRNEAAALLFCPAKLQREQQCPVRRIAVR